MRIDVSADSFDVFQGYSRVLLQQGRPILDRDWNEQTSILLDYLRTIVRAIYGRHGGPSRRECGFIPIVNGSEIQLRKGWYSIDGLILNCEEDTAYWKQKYGKEKYFSPPRMEPKKTYLMYLEAVEREVTAAEEKNLLDSALPGVDVAARGRMVWRANHTEWPSEVKDAKSCADATGEANLWFDDRHEQQTPPVLSFPKELANTLKALTKKSQNQLMRVEYHGQGFWKFSTDNAFALFEVIEPSAGLATKPDELMIRLGVLDSWVPVPGDVVELLTKENLQFNEPGELRDVLDVSPLGQNSIENIDRRIMKLGEKDTQSTAPSEVRVSQEAGKQSKVESIDDPAAAPQPSVDRRSAFQFVRVWNSKIEIDGMKDVIPGDYWQFASRDGALDTGDARLKRPTRLYAPVALIRTNADGTLQPDIQRFQRIVGPQWREINEDVDL